MAYDRSYWKDHVTDQSGEVIQQGTLLDQQHFNNMELGISDMTLAGAMVVGVLLNGHLLPVCASVAVCISSA